MKRFFTHCTNCIYCKCEKAQELPDLSIYSRVVEIRYCTLSPQWVKVDDKDHYCGQGESAK
jgi:hypothetical protein